MWLAEYKAKPIVDAWFGQQNPVNVEDYLAFTFTRYAQASYFILKEFIGALVHGSHKDAYLSFYRVVGAPSFFTIIYFYATLFTFIFFLFVKRRYSRKRFLFVVNISLIFFWCFYFVVGIEAAGQKLELFALAYGEPRELSVLSHMRSFQYGQVREDIEEYYKTLAALDEKVPTLRGEWGNHILTWANGFLFLILYYWGAFTYGLELGEDHKKQKTHFTSVGLTMLLFSLQVYIWTDTGILWIFAVDSICIIVIGNVSPDIEDDTFMMTIIIGDKKMRVRWLALAVVGLADYVIHHDGYPTNVWLAVCGVALAIWMHCWAYCFKRHKETMSPVMAMYISGIAEPLMWGCGIKVCVAYELFWCACLCVPLFLSWSVSLVYSLKAIPSRAPERERKVTMFEDLSEESKKETKRKGYLFNPNVYSIINPFMSTLWCFIFILSCAFDYYSLVVFFYLGLLASGVALGLYFTSLQLVTATKTSNILNWRGLYLCFDEYSWIAKYTTDFIVFFYANVFIIGCASFSFFGNKPVILGVVFGFVFTLQLYAIYQLLRLWTPLLTSFRSLFQDEWGPDHWKAMSPYFRDLVYWRPVRPEGYEPPKPFYLGLETRTDFLKFYFCLLWGCLLPVLTWFQIFSNVSMCYLMWPFYKYGLFGIYYLGFVVFRFTTPYRERIVNEYLFYEFYGNFIQFAVIVLFWGYFDFVYWDYIFILALYLWRRKR